MTTNDLTARMEDGDMCYRHRKATLQQASQSFELQQASLSLEQQSTSSGDDPTQAAQRWTDLSLDGGDSVANESECRFGSLLRSFSQPLQVSNPLVPLSNVQGICYRAEVITAAEQEELIQELHRQPFIWEGFEQRRRVQRYYFLETEHTGTITPSGSLPSWDSAGSWLGEVVAPDRLNRLRQSLLDRIPGLPSLPRRAVVEEWAVDKVQQHQAQQHQRRRTRPTTSASTADQQKTQHNKQQPDCLSNQTVTTFHSRIPCPNRRGHDSPSKSNGGSCSCSCSCCFVAIMILGRSQQPTPTAPGQRANRRIKDPGSGRVTDSRSHQYPNDKAVWHHVHKPAMLSSSLFSPSSSSSSAGSATDDLYDSNAGWLQSIQWDLQSADHYTDIRLAPRSLLLKQGDFLWQWRCRTVAAPLQDDDDDTDHPDPDPVLVITFFNLPNAGPLSRRVFVPQPHPDDRFGYIPGREFDPARQSIPHLQDMPPLADLLTIIITTSPIRSHPSTELLERSMATMLLGGSQFAVTCRKVIVCDGYRTKAEHQDHSSGEKDNFDPLANELLDIGSDKIGKNHIPAVTRKHVNDKQAMRNGIVTKTQAENYAQYKQILHRLCDTAGPDSPFWNAQVLELPERHGYGFALKYALQNAVHTPFVCVIQHDRTFMRPTPISETVHAMYNHPQIKYVGMTMRSNLLVREQVLSKYGKSYQGDYDNMTLQPPELCVPAKEFGPHSDSANSMLMGLPDKLRHNLTQLAEQYHRNNNTIAVNNASASFGRHCMSLLPTLFWYDNVHIVDTAFYRDFIFHPDYRMVARGGFVEDKLSPVLVRTLERLGLVAGHARFGCYLLDDHSGYFFTGHLDGGNYRTRQET